MSRMIAAAGHAGARLGRLLIIAGIVLVLILAVLTEGFTKWPSSWSKWQLWVWAHTDQYDDVIEMAQEAYQVPNV